MVIVAGETGSGKSTQLPKMCLEAGRGSAGMIGHTQPRRIAARSIAERRGRRARGSAGRACGLQGPLHRPGRRRHPGEGHDRRRTAGRAAQRPGAAQLRHDHRRRGSRAQPQHRFHPRLPEAAPTVAAGPAGDHHLGNYRHRAVLGSFRRRTRNRGIRPGLPRRAQVPADNGGRERS